MSNDIEDVLEINSDRTRSRNVKGMNSNVERKYGTLYSLGKFVSFLGWLCVVLGGLAVIAGLVMLGSDSRMGQPASLPVLGGGVFAALWGVLIVAQGQLMACFVSIEENTRETATLVKQQDDREGASARSAPATE